MKPTHLSRRLLQAVATVPTVILITGLVFVGHGRALAAGLVDLVLVMLIAFRWGFIEAGVASVLAAGCLDFFYMEPAFSLYERDPQDWISSIIFVVVALTAGHFADGIKRKAIRTENERTRLEKLYLTSRDISPAIFSC
jgi:two-component system sensor histidine kinase KdpD